MNMKKMLAVVAAATLVAAAAPAFANPFSDVPLNHWAYDAVEELSSKGILEGYPNGTFRGNRPMTRYEIASMVARMMDAELDGAELDKVKALVVEFQPELEALGVKVDSFDERLGKLEKGVGNLKFWMQMRFDYQAWDTQTEEDSDAPANNGFHLYRGRLFLQKQLSDGITWDYRWHNGRVDRYFVTMRDSFGIDGLTFRIGQFALDWEGNDGLYTANGWNDGDAFFFDGSVRGIDATYKKGGLTVSAFGVTNLGAGGTMGVYGDNSGDEVYGARIKYENEKFFISANGYWFNGDATNSANDPDLQLSVYWFSLGYRLASGLWFKGAYFMEDIDDLGSYGTLEEDDPNAYRVFLQFDQDLLKFTSLRLEYIHFDKGWLQGSGASPSTYSSGYGYTNKMNWTPLDDDMDLINILLEQQWTKKFGTYERYANYDMDGASNGDATEWQIGISYKYSPQLTFFLDYVDFDGRLNNGVVDEDYDNNLIRLRTMLNF